MDFLLLKIFIQNIHYGNYLFSKIKNLLVNRNELIDVHYKNNSNNKKEILLFMDK